MRTVKIEIRAEDQEPGCKNSDPLDCPGARALKRAFNTDYANVGFATANVRVEGQIVGVWTRDFEDQIYAFVVDDVPIPVGLYEVEVVEVRE